MKTLTEPMRAWKKVYIVSTEETDEDGGLEFLGYGIVELLIPAGARVVHVIGVDRNGETNLYDKQRCDMAQVVSIAWMNEKPSGSFKAVSGGWDSDFEYKVGETVRPKNYAFDDREVTCGSGIHFFDSEAKAREYML